MILELYVKHNESEPVVKTM